MPKVALWEVSDSAPVVRLAESLVDLERYLEDWIEAHPSMLQAGLEIIGRQFALDAGRLDLLALDPQGRLCAIEIKRGAVSRETVAQAMDYAACLKMIEVADLQAKADVYLGPRGKSLATMLADRHAASALDFRERQVLICVVGVGTSPDLERVATFLAQYEVPLTVVSYDAFRTQDGRRILCREVTDAEALGPRAAASAASTLETLVRQAEASGIGRGFRALVDAGQAASLYPRTFKTCVMFAPPARKTRALFTVWSQPRPTDGLLQAWVGGSVFSEFYALPEASVASHLGPDGWRYLNQPEAEKFAAALRALFAEQQGPTANPEA